MVTGDFILNKTAFDINADDVPIQGFFLCRRGLTYSFLLDIYYGL